MAHCHTPLVMHVGFRYPVDGDIARWTWEEGETQDTAVAVDLTGFSAVLEVLAFAEATTALLTLDSEDAGGITLGGTAGTIDIEVSIAQTTALGVGVFPYSLVLTPPGDPEGAFVFMEDFITVHA